eukprot:COSAG04_NODE_465_length_13935_cov_24.262142_12_plen_94_part_00
MRCGCGVLRRKCNRRIALSNFQSSCYVVYEPPAGIADAVAVPTLPPPPPPPPPLAGGSVAQPAYVLTRRAGWAGVDSRANPSGRERRVDQRHG